MKRVLNIGPLNTLNDQPTEPAIEVIPATDFTYEPTHTTIEIPTKPYIPPPLLDPLLSQVYARRKVSSESIQVQTYDSTANEDATQVLIDDRPITL